MHRLTLATALLALAGCAPGPAHPDKSAPAFHNVVQDVPYTGDAACASCHEEQFAGFQEHGMANSFYPLTAETAVEAFPSPEIRDPNARYIYQAVEDGGAYYQVETLRGADGRTVHELRRRMRFVMGSGTTARTYFDDSNGFLYELPLTWYTQEGRWDFSPGYRVANKRFDRQVPERCMACHNSYPDVAENAGGKYLTIPEGIGCERCHGPGQLHVDARRAVPEPPNGVDSTIVNPAHLTLEGRLDVCQQCHLHTTVSVLRDGKGAFDFRPSHRLEDYMALYVDTKPVDDAEVGVISHADRMKQSQCFIETVSAGRPFECTTCHNPHEGFRQSGPAYFNATCASCHAPAQLPETEAHQAEETNCIACHMPRVEATEAPHSSFTDHRIRVISSWETASSPGTNPSPGQEGSARLVEPYFVADSEPGRMAYEGMALVILGRQRGDARLLREGAAMLDRAGAEDLLHGEAEFLRGLARLELGDPSRAIVGLNAAVLADPSNPERLNALAQASEAVGGDPTTIEELYRRAVTSQPARADIWVNFGRFLESRGNLDAAIAAYRRAAQEQPWLAAGSYNLGTALARRGDLPDARRVLKRAARLRPQDPNTWGNLGAVYGQIGLADSARFAFEQAVELAPESASAAGNLGAFYLNQGSYRQALQLLDRAVQLDPQFADALANKALAHLQLGERASAGLFARRALQASPGHPVALQIQAALN